jgi:hypothetical protein
MLKRLPRRYSADEFIATKTRRADQLATMHRGALPIVDIDADCGNGREIRLNSPHPSITRGRGMSRTIPLAQPTL